MVRVFANGPGDWGSIPDWVIPKAQKMVLDTSLLNTMNYKVWIKGKWCNPREGVTPFPTTQCCHFCKENFALPSIMVGQYTLLMCVDSLSLVDIKSVLSHVTSQSYTRNEPSRALKDNFYVHWGIPQGHMWTTPFPGQWLGSGPGMNIFMYRYTD